MSRRSGASAAAALAATAAIALAGCGGSGRLSSSDLQNKASQVCALTSRRTNKIKTPSSPAGTEAFLRQGITALTPELTELRKLRPPADAQDVYADAMNAAAKQLALLRTAARQIAAGGDPVSTMQTLEQQLGPLVTSENQAWQSLEIPACVSH